MKFISVSDSGHGRMLINLAEVSFICRVDNPDRDDLVITKDGERYTCLSEDGAVKAAACIVEL